MKTNRTVIAIAMAAITVLAGHVAARGKNIQGDYAFVDVAVVPMDSERIVPHQTVVVRGDRIVYIGPAATSELAADVKVIEGRGRFLAPGLADMHVHLIGDGDGDFPLYLANGVTLVRNMAGTPEILKLRRRVAEGAVLGPTIVTAGALLDGDPPNRPDNTIVRTKADADRIVAEEKAAGYDLIKVYSNLSPEAFDAIAAAAKRNSIPFAGHVPTAVTVDRAMREGIASIEHLYGFRKATVRDNAVIGTGAAFAPQMIAIGRQIASGKATVDQFFDPDKTRALGKLAVRTHTWITPTLIVLQQGRLAGASAAKQLERPEMRYTPPGTIAYWRSRQNPERSAEDEQAIEALITIELREVALLHQTGAPLLAGSDVANPFTFPGFSLHEELALLVRAGLTPYEAMVTATRNPGRFLGQRDIGAIAVGHRADLLLLRGNPLDGIGHLRQPLGVMVRGRWLPEAELQQLLKSMAQSVAEKWARARRALPLALRSLVHKSQA